MQKQTKKNTLWLLGLCCLLLPSLAVAQQIACKKSYTSCVLGCNTSNVRLHRKCEAQPNSLKKDRLIKKACEKQLESHRERCIPACYQRFCVATPSKKSRH